MPNKVKLQGGPNLEWYIITAAIILLLGVQGLLLWIGFNITSTLLIYLYLKYKHNPIITSLLDTDWYKLTMGQVVFHQFPMAYARYQFINRGKTEFPEGFAKELYKELKYLSKVRLTDEEWVWLLDQFVLKPDYIEWLGKYRFNPEQVIIMQDGGDLHITVEGPWAETILWEVPLMAIISELYFKLTGKTYDSDDFCKRTILKADKMTDTGVKWSDFGTRRRFSAATQDEVNNIMVDYAPNYIGTSNPFFAMKYGIKPIGTYAHEAVMAMQARYNATESNQRWMEHWWQEYCESPKLLIALTDTLTTDVFLKTYTGDLLHKFSAVRQDSGDPAIFACKLLDHYKANNINPKEKKIVFSDNLNADLACELHQNFNDEIPCVMGIGTNLTNDCGHKPLNMVIKLIQIDFGDGMKSVVKLSDDHGKYTGNSAAIEKVKQELGIDYVTCRGEKYRLEN